MPAEDAWAHVQAQPSGLAGGLERSEVGAVSGFAFPAFFGQTPTRIPARLSATGADPTNMMFGAAMILGLVLAGAILLGLLWAVASYNGLVAARMEYQEAFSQVLLRLRLRTDLLPALVETARGHMRHERETLEGVNTAVREAAAVLQTLDPKAVGESEVQKLRQVDGAVNAALGRLLALSAVYPELRASPNMVRISEELSFAEHQLSESKQAYEGRVASYNTLRATAPQALLSSLLGFGDVPLLGISEAPAPQPEVTRLGSLKA